MISLYADTEINDAHPFTTLGIATLHDAVSCLLTQEINGENDIELEYPVDGEFFGEIIANRILTVTPNDAAVSQPYQIYNISKPINGVITVTAGHISYQLKRIVVAPFTSSSASDFITKLAAGIYGTHKFTFTTNVSRAGTFSFDNAMSVWDVMHDALEIYGGEWEFNRFTCTLKNRIGADNGAVIRYGSNLTDLKAEVDISETYTYILPYYRYGDYYRAASGRRMSTHTADFAEERTLAVDVTDIIGPGLTSVTNTQLNNAGTTWLNEHEPWTPEVSMDIEYQPLYQTLEYKDFPATDKLELGDSVRVVHDKMGIDVTTRVIRSEFDVIKDRYKRIEIGAVMPWIGQHGRWSGSGGGSK